MIGFFEQTSSLNLSSESKLKNVLQTSPSVVKENSLFLPFFILRVNNLKEALKNT